MYSAFPDCIRYGRAVPNQSVVMTLRDPYERFASQWHWLWHNNSEDPVLQQYLPSLQACDPVQAAQVYLHDVHPIMEEYCGELHLVSQSRALQSLLWHTPVKSMRYVSLDRFAEFLQREYSIDHYCVRNSQPNPYRQQFAPIQQLIRKTFAEDQRRWEQASLDINNI